MLHSRIPAPRPSLRALSVLLLSLLLSLALLVGPPLLAASAGAPGAGPALKTLNQTDDHGHAEGDDHEPSPTSEPAPHDDGDGHHEVTPPPQQHEHDGHDDGDGHHDVTPQSPQHEHDAHDDGDGHHDVTPTPQSPQHDDDLPLATPTPWWADPSYLEGGKNYHTHDEGAPHSHDSGDSHGSGGHGEGTTDGHAEGEGHGEGTTDGHDEGEGHGRAVPPPDPTTKQIVLGSFVTFNVIVLIVAAVLKRRMPQRKPRNVPPS